MNTKTYLVGGAVRDILMGIEPSDRDYVVVGSSPEEMIAQGFSQVGASFPVFLHPVTGDEYALARTERKNGVGYNGFAVAFGKEVTIEDDLIRRDLTINAMAQDLETGEIIDPYGGREDLKNGILRHTSEAFAEDPVRVLRIARFAARYGFTVHSDTISLCKKIIENGELIHVPRERIWKELEKGFASKFPMKMISLLQEIGAFNSSPISYYFVGFSSVELIERALKFVDDDHKAFAAAFFAMPNMMNFQSKLKVPSEFIELSKFGNMLMNVRKVKTASEVFDLVNIKPSIFSDKLKPSFAVAKAVADCFSNTKVFDKNVELLKTADAAIKKIPFESMLKTVDKAKIAGFVKTEKMKAIKSVM